MKPNIWLVDEAMCSFFHILKYSSSITHIYQMYKKKVYGDKARGQRICASFFCSFNRREHNLWERKMVLSIVWLVSQKKAPQKIVKYASRIMRLGHYNSTIIYIKMVSNGQFIIPALTKADRESSTIPHVVVDYSHSWPIRYLDANDSYARIMIIHCTSHNIKLMQSLKR